MEDLVGPVSGTFFLLIAIFYAVKYRDSFLPLPRNDSPLVKEAKRSKRMKVFKQVYYILRDMIVIMCLVYIAFRLTMDSRKGSVSVDDYPPIKVEIVD